MTLEEVLWDRMTGLYTHLWTRKYGDTPTREWEMALVDLTPDMVGKGINKIVKSKRFEEFPPNPIQFRAACMPSGEGYGLPSFDAAFNQATGVNTDKHPAVIYAMRLMADPFAFRQSKVELARQQFSEVWQKTVEHVMAGGELPEKPVEVESVIDVERAQKAGASALSDMKALFA